MAVSGTNLASIGYHVGSKEQLLNAAIGRLHLRSSIAVPGLRYPVPMRTTLLLIEPR